MNLQYKPDFDNAMRRIEAWFAHEPTPLAVPTKLAHEACPLATPLLLAHEPTPLAVPA
jgi:hypothetical protein